MRHLYYSTYTHFHYPVMRQILIVGLALLLIFSGVWLTPDRHTSTASSGSSDSEAFSLVTPAPETQPMATIDLGPEAIEAKAAVVYDVQSGTVLYEKAANEPQPLASITKLMTTLVVTELLNSNTEVVVSEEAVAQYGNSGLRVGERITAENLVHYAILSSSNDAAYALAHSIGEQLYPEEGSRPFIDAMNVRANELGLENTEFQNATGLDISEVESGAIGSARDITILMTYILEHHPELLIPTQLTGTRIYNEQGEYHYAANTNQLVQDIPNIIGSKTGYTDLAGGNLTVAFDAGFNRPVIVTVLGSSFQGRFDDMSTLLDATRQQWQ